MHDKVSSKINSLSWDKIHQELDKVGYVKLPPLLNPEQCQEFMRLYEQEDLYRSTINMSRYRFGEGEYKYFDSPLPSLLQVLRTSFYPELAKASNR
jgi:hypothetical protein